MRRFSHDEHIRRHHRLLEILQETRNPQTSLQKRQNKNSTAHNKAFTSRTEQCSFQGRRLHYTVRGQNQVITHVDTMPSVERSKLPNDGRFWTGMRECHFAVTDGTAGLFNQVLRPLLQRRLTCRNRVHLQPRPRQQELHRPQRRRKQMKASRNEVTFQAVTARLQRQSWNEGHMCKMHSRDAAQKDKNVMSGECFTTVG